MLQPHPWCRLLWDEHYYAGDIFNCQTETSGSVRMDDGSSTSSLYVISAILYLITGVCCTSSQRSRHRQRSSLTYWLVFVFLLSVRRLEWRLQGRFYGGYRNKGPKPQNFGSSVGWPYTFYTLKCRRYNVVVNISANQNYSFNVPNNCNYHFAVHESAIYSVRNKAIVTSLPKVIWEEGRVAALSHTYAVKSPLVTMGRPKSTPSRWPIPKPHYLPHPWTRLTCDAKLHPDPIRRFCAVHWTDRRTDRQIVHGKVWSL